MKSSIKAVEHFECREIRRLSNKLVNRIRLSVNRKNYAKTVGTAKFIIRTSTELISDQHAKGWSSVFVKQNLLISFTKQLVPKNDCLKTFHLSKVRIDANKAAGL